MDGRPAYNRLVVRAHIDRYFEGNGSPIEWPPRSPDLTPMEFLPIGILKDRVYASMAENPIVSLDDLKTRVLDACREVLTL